MIFKRCFWLVSRNLFRFTRHTVGGGANLMNSIITGWVREGFIV